MTIKILAFGQAAEITEKSEWEVTDMKHTAELYELLNVKFPDLAAIKYRMALNKQIIRGNTALNDGDVIALLPPFSGG
jgi:molybdopterin synthase sulfur carrier subunit